MFQSWVAFSSWKEEEEASTYTCFVKQNGEVDCSSEDPENGKEEIKIIRKLINLYYSLYCRTNTHCDICLLQRW